MSSVNTSLSVKYNETLKALLLHLYESIQLLMSLVTNIVLAPLVIFATPLSSRAVYFIQTGGSALSNTYCILRGQIKGYNSSITTIMCQGLWLGSYKTLE